MERRASVQNGIARLGDSTKGLLTFGDDMIHVMQEFSPCPKTKERNKGLHRIQEDKPMAASSGGVRLSANLGNTSVMVVQSRKSGKTRSDSREKDNESPHDDFSVMFLPVTNGSKSRSDSFGTNNESPRSVERIIDRSKPRGSSSGHVRLSADPDDFMVNIVEPRVSDRTSQADYLRADKESPRSVSRSRSNENPARTGGSTYRCSENKPLGTSASPTRPVPAGRSRPGIRAHRSGSFALRQFKENHQQNHQPVARRHYKTKNEALFETDQSSPLREVTSPTKSDWEKPTLRLHRSMDGSFCVRSSSSKDSAPRMPTSRQEDICFVPPIPLHNTMDAGWNDNAWERPMIEVAPGFSLPMCGTAETMQALHLDRIVHVECTSCSVFLACINTAYMLLCPGCRSVSPIETVGYNMSPTMGLGLRVEDILSQMQK
jgi:hypothetical protein